MDISLFFFNYYFKGTSQIRKLVKKKRKESDKNKRKKWDEKKNPKTT